jgi:hypothetical protein
VGEANTRDLTSSVWDQQSVWSQTANHLKARIDRLRSTMLALTVAAAVLTTLAAQAASLGSTVGRVLALAAGLSVGLVPLVRSQLGTQAVSDWARTRSVSEALKAEAFRFLAEVTPFRGADRESLLAERVRRVREEAGDLLVHTTGVYPVARPLPAVHDVDSYVHARLEPQIRWYRDRSTLLAARLGRARRWEMALGVGGVVLGAVASAFAVTQVSAWVAVVATVTAALSSHVAASRWEYQLVEYLRTADELERLREEWLSADHGEEAADRFVDRCEHVVSIQNDGWMAKWKADLR